MRNRMLYAIVGLLIIVMAGVLYDTRDDQQGTRDNLSIGCERANRTRAALHWIAMNTEGIPPSIVDGLNLTPREHPQADRPWLVDCDAAYP